MEITANSLTSWHCTKRLKHLQLFSSQITTTTTTTETITTTTTTILRRHLSPPFPSGRQTAPFKYLLAAMMAIGVFSMQINNSNERLRHPWEARWNALRLSKIPTSTADLKHLLRKCQMFLVDKSMPGICRIHRHKPLNFSWIPRIYHTRTTKQ